MTPHQHNMRGFTLIEMLVSVALFSIVMLSATAALFTVIGANAQTQSLNSMMTSTSFSLESMSRLIRTGTNFSCDGGGDCVSGGNRLTFTSQDGQTVTYRLFNGQVLREMGGITAPLSGSSVNITLLRFYVIGTPVGDGLQPRILIVMRGQTVGSAHQEDFAVQTTVSARRIDLE